MTNAPMAVKEEWLDMKRYLRYLIVPHFGFSRREWADNLNRSADCLAVNDPSSPWPSVWRRVALEVKILWYARGDG